MRTRDMSPDTSFCVFNYHIFVEAEQFSAEIPDQKG
jgi:hypothetical protein